MELAEGGSYSFLTVWTVLLVGCMALCIAACIMDAIRRFKIRDVPRTRIAGLGEQRAGKVRGTVRLMGEPLRALASGLPCVYYETRIQEHQSERGWTTILWERHGQDFLLDDGTGAARVCMRLIEVDTHVHAHNHALALPGPELTALVRTRGRDPERLGPLRYTERVIQAGDTVVVCGSGIREPDPDPRAAVGGYRDGAVRLALIGSPGAPIHVSDNPALW